MFATPTERTTVNLPSTDSPIRDLFDITDLVAIGSGEVTPPTFPQARQAARQTFISDEAIRDVHSICLKADGSLTLERFGPQGAHKTVWTFTEAPQRKEGNRPASFEVNGFKIRTRTQRRYVVVATRAMPFTNERGTYVAFAEVVKRTDNIETARKEENRRGVTDTRCYAVVVDTTTGRQV